jgi:hypothetical protein
MKQYYIGKWWGHIKLLGQHVTSYLQLLILLFTSITAYAEINKWTLDTWNILIPFWAFALVIIIVVLALVMFEYTLSWPSFFSVWNFQVWNHKNPLKEEIDKLHQEISELKGIINASTKRDN